MISKTMWSGLAVLVAVGAAAARPGAVGQTSAGAGKFRSLMVTRQIGHERFLPYLEAARPDVVQVGNYGAMFHGYAGDARSTGWPMNLPLSGEREVLAFQRELTAKIQGMGLKVVGHFRLVNVLGDWDERLGFVDWYENHWPEDLLGPKPLADVAELLQRDAGGRPLMQERYPGRHYLHLCLSSPHARQMLKQMLDLAIAQGVDGVISLYNYHYGCACPYCQESFKTWLKARMPAEVLRERLGIDDLEEHRFDVIPARIGGYPVVSETPGPETQLPWLAQAWAAEAFKAAFDDIFILHGRGVKPDLIVATWNHLGNIGRGEERAFLPIGQWGRDEDYFWYSGGAAFVDRAQDLAAGKAGDAWLAHLYLRALGEGKPFVMGKYERVRLAMSMAEGYATGGLGMGRYMNFRDPTGFDVLVRYTQFRHAREALYDGAEPVADLALLLPRQAVQQRRPDALDAFRTLGQSLVERSVLIDVLVDQRLSDSLLDRYPALVLPGAMALSDAQYDALEAYAAAGGLLMSWGRPEILDLDGAPRKAAFPGFPGLQIIDEADAGVAAEAMVSRLQDAGASRIEAPWMVRVAAYRQAQRYLLHLVNYNREAGAREDNRGGPADERPEPVGDIRVDLRLPPTLSRPTRVTLHDPDAEGTQALVFSVAAGRIRFVIPRLRVYAIAVIE